MLPAFGRRTAVRRYRGGLAVAGRAVLALLFGFVVAGALGIAATAPASAQVLPIIRGRRGRRHRAPPMTGRCWSRRSRSITTTNNSRVSAVGNVQMFYNGTSVEADKVIYDQKTKRLHAEGNIRMTDADGRSPTPTLWI